MIAVHNQSQRSCSPLWRHQSTISTGSHLTFLLLQVGSIVNFALMYLLAPTAAVAAGGAASQSLLVRALSEEFLVKWGAPGMHTFKRPSSLYISVLSLVSYVRKQCFAMIWRCEFRVTTLLRVPPSIPVLQQPCLCSCRWQHVPARLPHQQTLAQLCLQGHHLCYHWYDGWYHWYKYIQWVAVCQVS